MIKNGVAFGVGVTVGIIAVGAVAYYYYKKKHTMTDREKEASKKFSDILMKAERTEKSLTELLCNQTFVEVLTSRDLTEWFKANKDEFPGNTKMIISVPTEEALQGLGYAITEKIDPNKNVIQLFYDEEKKEVVRIRLVSYLDIDSNLQAHLIEEDGMIVVTT